MHRHILVIAKYTLLEALRNRLLWLALTIACIAFGVSAFIGDVAITEHTQIQMAILSALLRISGVVMLTLIVVTTVLREMQDKSLELLLAMDIPRASYYFENFSALRLSVFYWRCYLRRCCWFMQTLSPCCGGASVFAVSCYW